MGDGHAEPVSTAVDADAVELRRRLKALERALAERDRVIAELHDSEQRFRTVFEHAPLMVGAIDQGGRVTLWNRECERMLGYSAEEIRTLEDALTFFLPDAAARDRARRAMATSDGIFREYRLKAKDGGTRIQMWADFRLPNGSRISVGHDVTSQRAMEAQLGQAHRLESVGQLTSGIAHDFNNLLTVILACSDLVERQLTERSGALDELRGAARRGEALIRKLLAFSRQEPRSFEPVDVERLVRELAPTLRRLLPESIDMQVSSDVPLPVIEADAGALEQLLVNLVTNARDAMPWRGNLTVETRVAPVPAGDPRGPTGSYLVLSVSDSGTGMDEATREHMFEPFFSTKPPSEGTGLGLAIVYGLVRQHGGFIDVQSAKGKGTTVDVHLPVPEDQALPSSPDPERVRRAVVLVVEDNAAIRRVARVALEDEGYAVLVASDGVEALRLLDERKVDLVVADVVMPGLTGPELYHELAAQGTPPRFVLTSGYANAEYDETASSLGIPLLRKPWSVVDLAGCVERALEKE